MGISATPGPIPHGPGPNHAGRTLRRRLPALRRRATPPPFPASGGHHQRRPRSHRSRRVPTPWHRRRQRRLYLLRRCGGSRRGAPPRRPAENQRRRSISERGALAKISVPKQKAYPLGFKLGGKRVGIVGLGSIGLEVAKRLEAFGCDISYHSRNKKPSVSYVFYPDIHELAAASDILVLCCALTDQTRHMINRDVLLALGKEGFVVNIARGAVIDEKELVACLQKGEIGGAGLDVFENEPCVPNELYELDNVVLSRHAAVFTVESFGDLFELMCGNLEAFFENKPLISPVLEG